VISQQLQHVLMTFSLKLVVHLPFLLTPSKYPTTPFYALHPISFPFLTTINKFCKNARFLKVIRFRSLEQEYTPETAQVARLASELEVPDNNLSYYVLLRAVDRFYATHSRYPGFFDDKLELETGTFLPLSSSLSFPYRYPFLTGTYSECSSQYSPLHLGSPPPSSPLFSPAILNVCRYSHIEVICKFNSKRIVFASLLYQG
jgi:hypothetical protein